MKLKEAASALGKKFGAGASVSKSAEGKPEIDVQVSVTAVCILALFRCVPSIVTWFLPAFLCLLCTSFHLAIQGDVVYDLPELLTSLFGIPEEAIICRD